MNLLILVVAVAAIIVFFIAGFSTIILEWDAGHIINRLSKKTFTVASSSAYCFSDSFFLPRNINVSGEDFIFVMKADVQEINIDSSKR